MLDNLAGGVSLTSTITSQLRLRIVSLLGLSLLLVWLLSPLVGQASFRQLSLGTRDIVSQSSYSHMTPTSVTNAFEANNRGAVYGVIEALFNAAIMSSFSTKTSPLDLWGNLKVPRIEYFEGRNSPDSNGWFDTDLENVHDSDIYVSLAGLPLTRVQGSPYTGDRMQIQTTYLNLTCENTNGAYNLSQHSDKDTISAVYGEFNSAMISWPNATAGVPRPYGGSIPYRANDSYQESSPEAFFFAYSATNDLSPALSAGCLVRQTYIEVDVLCARSTDCRVMKIRRSQLSHYSPNVNFLDGYSKVWTWNLIAEPFISSVFDLI